MRWVAEAAAWLLLAASVVVFVLVVWELGLPALAALLRG